MMPVLSVAQMREIDKDAIAGNLTIGYSYMLKAGMGLFNMAREMVGDRNAAEIAIICGKGNNGGDGYVAGRLLLDAGFRVMCYSICDVETLKGEARLAFSEYAARKGNSLELSDAADLSGLSQYNLIIDAMLGTGLQGDPKGLCATVIEAINSSRVQVLAADTPSGLDNDAGVARNPCVRATVTVTMGFPKIGTYFYPGREYVGKLVICDLNYPDEIVAEKKRAVFAPGIETMCKLLPPRRQSGTKFDHGLALLLCGSRGLTGSAALVSTAALRTGCGMAHLAVPGSALPVLAAKLTEPVLHQIHETSSGTPAVASLGQIRELAVNKQAVCIGPGISYDSETSMLVRELVKTIDVPIVLDADGINAYKDCAGELGNHAGDLVITPHRGEWQRLFGELPAKPSAVIERIREVAMELNITVLLKGSPTVMADPAGIAYVLPFGNSALAKAGTGDVLSGIIVSLIAQGARVPDAAMLGAFILGETGVMTSRKLGEYSVLATDLPDQMHSVIRALSVYQVPAEYHDNQNFTAQAAVSVMPDRQM